MARLLRWPVSVPVAGVVLQCPFASVLRLVVPTNQCPSESSDAFRVLDILRDASRPGGGAGVGAPVWVVHGEADGIVPVWHGRAVSNAVPEDERYPPLFVPGAGHNDVEKVLEDTTGRVFEECVEAFYNHCVAVRMSRHSSFS